MEPDQSDLSSAFELLAPSLKVFYRVVGCLAKLGKDVAVIFRSDELVLHGADEAHSAAMQFAFRRRCFRSTPAMRVAASGSFAPPLSEASVSVVAKALFGALRGAQNRMAESLVIGLAGGSTQPKLVLQFAARFGALVRHRVPLLEVSPFLPGEPSSGPHTAALSPELLSKVLNHCAPQNKKASCEEITLAAEPKEGIRVRSYDLLEGGGRIDVQETRSEVLILRSDLEACHLDARGGDVTLSGRGLREFAKTTDGYMRELDALGLLEGSPLLELRFGCEGGVVLCRLATAMEGVVKSPQDFSAVLLVATRELSANAGGQDACGTAAATQPQAETQQSAATQGSMRRAQPKQGSKRRAVALPPASAFDAFPDHSVSASQAPTMSPSPSPAPPNMMRPPSVPSTPQRQVGMQNQTAMPAFSVQHINCPPTALSPSPSVQQQANFIDSVPLLQAANPTSLLQSETLALPSQSSSATQPGQPQFHQAQLVTPVSRPLVQEVPRPLVRDQYVVPSASPPPTQPVIESRPFLFQGGRVFSPGSVAPTTSPVKPVPVPAAGSSIVLASSLASKVLDVGDYTDDEEVGADPDEVAFARGDIGAEDSVDWFDVEKLW
mmetsp:Transcript_40045/g.63594  ORF Transcript_40045/g.63594 Transcript_40045/m.63594 type:complete len:609 (-) Transcript_40045:250-2076(-)